MDLMARVPSPSSPIPLCHIPSALPLVLSVLTPGYPVSFKSGSFFLCWYHSGRAGVFSLLCEHSPCPRYQASHLGGKYFHCFHFANEHMSSGHFSELLGPLPEVTTPGKWRGVWTQWLRLRMVALVTCCFLERTPKVLPVFGCPSLSCPDAL